MLKYFNLILILIFFNQTLLTMEKKPYHHLPDGTFRNPEGSPKRDNNVKFSYKIFNAERKKIEINFPDDHVVPRDEVLKSLQENKDEDLKTMVKEIKASHEKLEDNLSSIYSIFLFNIKVFTFRYKRRSNLFNNKL